MKRPRRQRGFTLIETLLALVVAAFAAAVISAMVRGLYDHAVRQARVENQVLALINQSVRLQHLPWREGVPHEENGELSLLPASADIPLVKVANHQLREGMPVPPRNLAYTPFQIFSVAGTLDDGQSLHFLAPALTPPVGATLPLAIPSDIVRKPAGGQALGAPTK